MEMEMEKRIGTAAEQGDGVGDGDGSSGKVCANDDLLIEILVRLPVKSVVRFKSVSKRWLSLIADRSFRRLFCTQNPNPNPPSGLFLQTLHTPEYDLVCWDTGNPITKPPFTTLDIDFDIGGTIEILHSCSNGLLLCHCGLRKFYVYNPVLNLVKILPALDNWDWKSRSSHGMIIALDPSESSHDQYRVVCIRTLQAEDTNEEFHQVETYYSCSEMGGGQWMVSGSSEPYDNGTVSWDFSNGVYCNDAVHWLQADERELLYFKFSEKTIRCMDGLVVEEEGEDNDAFVQSSHSNIVESYGKILLVVSHLRSEKHRVYELNNDYSGWSSKYCVNVDPVSRPMDSTGKMYLLGDHTLLVVGGNDKDLFFVLEVAGKIIRYDFMSNTFYKLCDVKQHSCGCIPGCFFFFPSLISP